MKNNKPINRTIAFRGSDALSLLYAVLFYHAS